MPQSDLLIVHPSNPEQTSRSGEEMEVTDMSFIASNGIMPNDSECEIGNEEIIEEEHKNCDEREDSVLTSPAAEGNGVSVHDDEKITTHEHERDGGVSNDIINS